MGPEFETVFDRGDPKANKVIAAETSKADTLQNRDGGRSKTK